MEDKITGIKEINELRGQDIIRTTYVGAIITNCNKSSGREKERAKSQNLLGMRE